MTLILLIILFPLSGVLINGLFGSKLREKSAYIANVAIGLSWVCSILAFLDVIKGKGVDNDLYSWIAAGGFEATVGFKLDELSAIMILVVTTVSLCIHIYSIGYMRGDRGYARYFTYLNLFVFSMLVLVLANNYLLMFVGWEAVGLCSYLLIGFWYEKKSASDAGKKAFIVNRIGDFGFILGLFLIFMHLGTLKFVDVFSTAPTELSQGVATAITLLLFMGAVGKSAQFPLYVWLPDAMEGPTPVSSLIHAATMVTAGVYMVARSYVLYELAPLSMEVVALIGAFTAIFATTIALTSNDIKRILAYSTVSQLGYMFIAVGIGAYSVGIFHLMTHAFFKGLMFLTAGSVMHAMSDELDMRKMGGLYSKMKITAWTFIIGALAISGIPPLSGFWSKDEILSKAYSTGNIVIWVIGAATAFLTALYMFRLIFITFFGASRVEPEVEPHVHESPRIMTIPLVILAIFSVTAGWVGIGEHSPFHSFLGRAIEPRVEVEAQLATLSEGALIAISVLLALAGIGLAYIIYIKRYIKPEEIADRAGDLYSLVANKYYVDEIYDALIIAPFRGLATFLANAFDVWIIDGIVDGVGLFVRGSSAVLRRMQSGYIQNYALAVVLGTVVMLGYYFLR